MLSLYINMIFIYTYRAVDGASAKSNNGVDGTQFQLQSRWSTVLTQSWNLLKTGEKIKNCQFSFMDDVGCAFDLQTLCENRWSNSGLHKLKHTIAQAEI